MLFRKRIEKVCSHCQYATALNEEQMLCIKKGVVLAGGKCRKFTYDPIKRIPPKPKALDFDKYSQEDYNL